MTAPQTPIAEEALQAHRQWRGKLDVAPKCPLSDRHDLAMAYTPGVAEPCKAIAADPQAA